mmetsp:Transcript_10336/g.14174  ORF Transcript_10336/g.14174 Transcript_10336/m.14174 type:complete len:569 (-) Transcript_10336:101-1807(-)
MSEHYQQLPTPAAWATLESNSKPTPVPTYTPQANDSPQHTPEIARRALYQPMKNSRSSIEGTSPPKYPEQKMGSSIQVTSQYDSTKDNGPAQAPTPPSRQDHYQDFSLIARDSPPPSASSTHATPTASPVIQPREYQALPNIPRTRTATTYATHTSPNALVHTPPPKSSHYSDNSPNKHYQSINPIAQQPVTPPPTQAETKDRSHYMAVPDFSKLKSESFANAPRRTHAATVADVHRRVEPVASDSVLYSRSKPVDSVEMNFGHTQRDEYQKIPSKEEMQSMMLKRTNSPQAQQPAPKPTPAAPPSPPEDKEPANGNDKPSATEASPAPTEAAKQDPVKEIPEALEGILGKKGDVGVIKAWKRRWFVLRLDLLVYYKSREDREHGEVIGFIPLCDASAVYPSSNAPTNTAFQIDTKERIWYLRADTRPEMDLWIEACKKNCNIKEHPTPHDDVQKRQSMVAIARNQTLTREGELEKLHGTTFRLRKVFVKSGILYKYLSKTDPQPSKITLFKSTIEDEVPEHGPLAFRVYSGSKVITFRASSDKEKEEWLELLMKHKLLTETIINPHY